MARELLYTAQISALITPEMRARIDALEMAHPITRGEVIRAALEAGLTSVERHYAALVGGAIAADEVLTNEAS